MVTNYYDTLINDKFFIAATPDYDKSYDWWDNWDYWDE
ncbi:unnamed protein product, partial [marine sediment metagenome]